MSVCVLERGYYQASLISQGQALRPCCLSDSSLHWVGVLEAPGQVARWCVCVCVCVRGVSASGIFQVRWSVPSSIGRRRLWSSKGRQVPGPNMHPTYPASPGVSDGWTGPPSEDGAPHTHSPVRLMDGGLLQLAPCCDKQQMFTNNVYRPGLHLQMTHTCFQSNRPREAIHPQSSGWSLHRWISPPHVTLGATADSGATDEEPECWKISKWHQDGAKPYIPLHTVQYEAGDLCSGLWCSLGWVVTRVGRATLKCIMIQYHKYHNIKVTWFEWCPWIFLNTKLMQMKTKEKENQLDDFYFNLITNVSGEKDIFSDPQNHHRVTDCK